MIKTDISSIKELSSLIDPLYDNYIVPRDMFLTKTLVNTEVKLKTTVNEAIVKRE